MSEQGTQEWRQERCGNVTASRISDVLAKPLKGAKEATTRRNYRAEIICELLTGKVQEGFMSYDMRRGIEQEPFARADYEIRKGVIVTTAGFVPHPRIPRAGASPDGLVGSDGLVQFKAPKTANHLDYLMAGIVPSEYRPQMQFEMACTERKWCDFVSYDSNLPEHLQLFIIRFERDEAAIAEIEDAVCRLNSEIDEIIANLPGQVSGQKLNLGKERVSRREGVITGDALQ
jgi:YqaJ-like viral recombinase domain